MLGFFQCMNVLTVLMLISFLTRIDHVSKIIAVGICVIFQITTYIRYVYREKHSVDVIRQAWSKKSDANRKQIRTLALLYSLLSPGVFFGVVIYLGIKRTAH